ncbi:MAG: hypothetical protein V1735_00560 [Nanoarchaeota archaeon]
MFTKAVPEYNEADILRLYKHKKLTVEEIAKVYNIDHNVVKRILLDTGVKLDDLTNLIGTHKDYQSRHSRRTAIVGAAALLFIIIGIGFVSVTQEGSLLGKNRATGFVVASKLGMPPCPYDCCNDEYHVEKGCPSGQDCVKGSCEAIEAES